MGKSSKQRRAAEDLLRAAVQAWGADPARHEALVAALAARTGPALTAIDGVSREALEGLWRDGWTPTDVVHVIARRLSAAHGDEAARLVVSDTRSPVRRGQALHPRWEAQVTVLAGRDGLRSAGPRDEVRVRLRAAVLGLLVRLPAVPQTLPPPGAPAAAPLISAGLDERMLARVRALLAKAEGTEFDEEAEALTAKAQELIARHAIDEALLHTAADVGEPSVRRILVDDPYADAKASLLAQVGGANRCRVVFSPDCGWVTAFGYDHDLDAVELLAASLLAQAMSAMAREGSRRDAWGRSRTRSFRRSFLFGFAHRIGQRLQRATDEQIAAADAQDHGRLLPVLSAREDRLRAAVADAFGALTSRSTAVSHAEGWAAGQAAAELADLQVSARALRRSRAS